MMSIQELGLSILSESPNKFYVIGGQEYGVKDKYIAHLVDLYGTKHEYGSVDDVINMMSTRHLIPLQPAVYVVRYDETFVSAINEAFASRIKRCNIVGTVVCLYSDDKSITKIDKYLPEYTAQISAVNPKFIEKYLHNDFPNLDDRSIKIAAFVSENYGHARNICTSMSYANLEVLAKSSQSELQNLFGCSTYCDENQIKLAIASKNFKQLVSYMVTYPGELDGIIYMILQTMIDMEKELTSKYHDSYLKDCIRFWTIEDTYYMFMHAYDQLTKLRSITSTNVESSLIYLFGLLSFKRIPSLEAMQ